MAFISSLFVNSMVTMYHVGILLMSSLIFNVGAFLIDNPPIHSDSNLKVRHEVYKNVGQPLILTPLVEQGQIQKARTISRVHLPSFKGMTSFSGYFTVNKKCKSNLFFWFFPAQNNWREAPVVLWLQGGPGASSLYGLFEELGPISFNNTLKKRKHSWNIKNNVLFIDQPVGTGFSFTRKNCYAKNETDVARDLYSALIQFYKMFPFLQENKFYAAGESYGGHYVPSIGYTIHKNNPSAKYKIKLSGLMIGNGLMDMMYQSGYSSYLYQLGLIDNRQRDTMQRMEQNLVKHLQKKDWEAGLKLTATIFGLYSSFVGNVSKYNYLKTHEDSINVNLWEKFVTTPRVRKSLHVGSSAYSVYNSVVHSILQTDFVQSVKSKVEELLRYYPVIFYHGQLDIICGYPMAVNFFRSLQWGGSREYLQAERRPWCVDGQLAGFIKSGHNLHEVLVRSAGHMVPQDQPLWAFQLVNSVTSSPANDSLRQLTTCGNSNV